MPIDQYEHDFQHLVEVDLQEYLKRLKLQMEAPSSLSNFAINGLGIKSLCRNLGLESDFPGCYVLIEGDAPVYVGISKCVLQRLRQHVRGRTHFDASLAYRIASHHMPHQHTRSIAMEQKTFMSEFDAAKGYLLTLSVAFVRIDNPLALYVFEPYCAMHFDTSKWNTFETH